uniref:secretoglobin family 1D member-like n=1 Tax=Odobenus rosmarus divergens TaxID=9708 RepID=UPI00063CB25F|nr:PREDICTED: secretoglobin family 1D member-like [Odobenus rosmarus divergens]
MRLSLNVLLVTLALYCYEGEYHFSSDGHQPCSNIKEPWGKCDFPYIDSISFSSPTKDIPSPSLAADLLNSLLQHAAIYKRTLEKYNPPQEVIQAKMEEKACTDWIPFKNRMLMLQKQHPAAIWKTPFKSPQLLQKKCRKLYLLPACNLLYCP